MLYPTTQNIHTLFTIHTLYTPYTHPIHTLLTIHTLYTPYTHPIHTLYTPYTHHIHTIYTPYTHHIHTIQIDRHALADLCQALFPADNAPADNAHDATDDVNNDAQHATDNNNASNGKDKGNVYASQCASYTQRGDTQRGDTQHVLALIRVLRVARAQALWTHYDSVFVCLFVCLFDCLIV